MSERDFIEGDQRDYAEEAYNAELLANPEQLTEAEFNALASESQHSIRADLMQEGHEVLDRLRDRTRPIPGRPGWRLTDDGRSFYSAAWLGLYE